MMCSIKAKKCKLKLKRLYFQTANAETTHENFTIHLACTG